MFLLHTFLLAGLLCCIRYVGILRCFALINLRGGGSLSHTVCFDQRTCIYLSMISRIKNTFRTDAGWDIKKSTDVQQLGRKKDVSCEHNTDTYTKSTWYVRATVPLIISCASRGRVEIHSWLALLPTCSSIIWTFFLCEHQKNIYNFCTSIHIEGTQRKNRHPTSSFESQQAGEGQIFRCKKNNLKKTHVLCHFWRKIPTSQ